MPVIFIAHDGGSSTLFFSIVVAARIIDFPYTIHVERMLLVGAVVSTVGSNPKSGKYR
jgi:hypothetical protein